MPPVHKQACSIDYNAEAGQAGVVVGEFQAPDGKTNNPDRAFYLLFLGVSQGPHQNWVSLSKSPVAAHGRYFSIRLKSFWEDLDSESPGRLLTQPAWGSNLKKTDFMYTDVGCLMPLPPSFMRIQTILMRLTFRWLLCYDEPTPHPELLLLFPLL